AVEALVWIASYSFGDDSNKAHKVLFDKHLTSPKIGQATLLLPYIGATDVEKRLRAVLEKNPNRDVQAQACFALAQYLKQQATRPGARTEKGSTEEAEKMFQQVADKYADVKIADSRLGTGTLGEAAKKNLTALRNQANLVVGKVAPEIEGEDID